jgi:hypothetical protein
VRLCERVFRELEGDEASRFARVAAASLARDQAGVVLSYNDPREPAAVRQFACRFKGSRFAPGQSELIGVMRISGEELSLPALLHLRRRVGLE